MSSIQLSHFNCAEHRPSKRITRCKNCYAANFVDQLEIAPGADRIVISGGWGPSSRSLTLCKDCAAIEAENLRQLLNQIENALDACN